MPRLKITGKIVPVRPALHGRLVGDRLRRLCGNALPAPDGPAFAVAASIIPRESGTRFDPRVVAAFDEEECGFVAIRKKHAEPTD